MRLPRGIRLKSAPRRVNQPPPTEPPQWISRPSNVETITITGGTEQVDLTGSAQGSPHTVLSFDGVPAFQDRPDDEGRVIARSSAAPDRPDLPQRLRIALATGQLRRPLATTLLPLLDLLAHGRYEVDGPVPLSPHGTEWTVATPSPDGSVIVEAEHEGRYLVPTAQQWPPEDSARVDYYRSAIGTGHRPAVVVLRLADAGGSGGYVLDGHHALAAYRAADVTPTVVRIARIDPPTITVDDDAFPGAGPARTYSAP